LGFGRVAAPNPLEARLSGFCKGRTVDAQSPVAGAKETNAKRSHSHILPA
jgi:hypothetical protein